MRSKNQIRGSKQKGSGFEYDVYSSLKPIIPDIRLTKQLGFVSQYDLISSSQSIVIECKKHKGFSWNELQKYYVKLQINAPITYNPILIFQANRQPCLVMVKGFLMSGKEALIVTDFENYFNTPFIKHKKGEL